MGLFRKSLLAIPFVAITTFAQMPPPLDFGGPGHGPFGHGPGPIESTVTGAPFSATKTLTHQETLADGNTVQQSHTEKIYRDSDGRMRSESTITTPSGTTNTRITILDPVAGTVSYLNPADSTAVTMTIPKPPSNSAQKPPQPPAGANSPQPVTTSLGTKTVAGVTATGESITLTIPAGAIGNSQAITSTREVWTSTDLKIPVQATSTDPLHGNSTMVLSGIVQGAQDSTLFQIPSNYTVKNAPGPGGKGSFGPPMPAPDGPPLTPDGLI